MSALEGKAEVKSSSSPADRGFAAKSLTVPRGARRAARLAHAVPRFHNQSLCEYAVVKKILNVKGPFSPHADDLRKTIDTVMKYAELRNISAHGMMYRPDPNDTSLSSKLCFRMYRMLKGGKLDEVRSDFTLKEYTDEQAALTKAARKFQDVVRTLGLLERAGG